MIYIEIAGVLFATWLICSTFYSFVFHIKNYIVGKSRIRNNEVGETYIRLHNQVTKNLILLQTIKLSVGILILFILL